MNLSYREILLHLWMKFWEKDEEENKLPRNSIGRIVNDSWGSEGVQYKKVGKRDETRVAGYYLGNLGKKKIQMTATVLRQMEGQSSICWSMI